jgi:uncharacterized protein (UPF0333 family)
MYHKRLYTATCVAAKVLQMKVKNKNKVSKEYKLSVDLVFVSPSIIMI